jgi:hypothetical protein
MVALRVNAYGNAWVFASMKTQLEKLEYQLDVLIERRNRKVERARQIMARANAEFDDRAVPLSREIKLLRMEARRSLRPQRHVSKPLPVLNMSEEDAQHFRDLAAQYR